MAAAVCTPANADDQWPFDVSVKKWFSCASSAGATNDLGTTPHMCADDPASVRIEVTPGLAECLVASASECKIPMRDFVSLDYDFGVEGCDGVWAAPLWMTPDDWRWGGGSGEIDSLEFCSRDSIHLNFAGGGHQTVASAFSIDGAAGHVTVRKDAAGIVTISACPAAEAAASHGQCAAPQYKSCAECLNATNTYGCWCNAESDPPNIYGSGGCAKGSDCMWTLVSDIWNGVSGDAGYKGCMTAVGGVVDAGKPNLKSSCAISVERIVLRGSGPGGRLKWGEGSPASCSVLSV